MKHRKIRQPLIYSEDFREAIRKAFPNSEIINRLLAENSFTLGGYMEEGKVCYLSPSLVVDLLEAGRHEELLTVAKAAEEKRRLYEMWQNEVYE